MKDQGVESTYDNNGNLTYDGTYTCRYDAENRLTLIYIDVNADSDYDSGTDTLKATFAYDALGRRIEKVDSIAGTTTRYYYDDQRIALQRMASGGTETDDRYFVYGNYIDEVLLMANCSPLMAGDYYYGHDHLYSPAVLFDSSGTVVERYEYDVYGACRMMTSGYSLLTSSAYGNPYTFTGRELDSLDNNTLKVYYYRARSYDPQTGRFLQRDPLRYVDGMNLYEYVRNQPLTHADPTGMIINIGGGGISIDLPWPLPDITLINSKWMACKVCEQVILAGVRGHTAEAFRMYANLTDRKDPYDLSEGQMSELFSDYDLYSNIITPLVQKCRSSSGWQNATGQYQYGGSSKYIPPQTSGTWKAALNKVTFNYSSSCLCNNERKELHWHVSFSKNWAFDSYKQWNNPDQLPRNLIVLMMQSVNYGLDCGWSSFTYIGEKSGVEVIK